MVKMNQTALEVLALHTILTIGGYVIVGVLCLTVGKIQEDIVLFLILSVNIFFTAIGCEWFYQGIENFKYITIRGLCVKTLSVVFLFLFVHSRDDLYVYAFYTVIGSTGGNIFNFVRLRKYLQPNLLDIRKIHPFHHVKPVFRIFILNVIISIYMQLDVIMLGFMKDASAVGYYSASLRVCSMLMGLTTSLVASMIPRMSNLVGTDQKERFNELAQKTVDFVFFFSTPIVAILILTAPFVIHILCGESFVPAITTMRILAPQMLIISLGYILGSQILLPLGKEKIFIWAAIGGAVVNIVLNVILIPEYSQDGAAIGTILAHLMVTSGLMLLGRKYLPVKYMSSHYLKCILSAMAMYMIIELLWRETENEFVRLVICCICALPVYAFFLYLLRDKFLLTYCYQMKTKVSHLIKSNHK